MAIGTSRKRRPVWRQVQMLDGVHSWRLYAGATHVSAARRFTPPLRALRLSAHERRVGRAFYEHLARMRALLRENVRGGRSRAGATAC
jgi:hypothetical protein